MKPSECMMTKRDQPKRCRGNKKAWQLQQRDFAPLQHGRDDFEELRTVHYPTPIICAAVAYVATVSDAQSDRDTVYLIPPYGRRRLPQDSDRPTATTVPAPSLTPDYDGDDDDFGYIGETEGKKRRKGSNCVKKNLKRFMAAVQHAPRPHLRRNSPVSTYPSSHGYASNAPSAAGKRFDVSDSDSDDEPPPAIKFSKVTEALLNNGPMPSSPPKHERSSDAQRAMRSTSAPKSLDTPRRASNVKVLRQSSPSALASSQQERGQTPPRIVRIGSGQKGSGRRTISIGGPYPQRFPVKREPTPQAEAKPEIVTPAPAPRHVRVTRSRAGSNTSQDGNAHPGSSTSRPGSRNGYKSGSDQADSSHLASSLSRHTSLHHAPETVSRYNSSTLNRSRNFSSESAAPPPGSTRIKRAPIGTGTFLKSGPVRRGFRRRDSEDNISPADENHSSFASGTPLDERVRPEVSRSRSGSVVRRADSVEPVSVHDYAQEKNSAYASRSSSRQAGSHAPHSSMNSDSRPSSRQTSHEYSRSRQPSAERYQPLRQPSIPPVEQTASVGSRSRRPSNDNAIAKLALEDKPVQRRPSLNQPQYRYVPPKSHTDASEEQENMPPPTFKRNKDSEFKYLGKSAISVMSDDEKPNKSRTVDETPVPNQSHHQDRKALGAISGNTPHRPAPPPPPKMSVLETATATGGASTTRTRKKRAHMIVKEKVFTQMGKLGKGGSSEVYCVMAENYKTFALKKVKLDDCDEMAVRGYKGEIDLLKQLTDVERVVRLIDWELKDDKGELYVLMEKGDTDFNRLLTLRINGVDAKLDTVFVRYHWREMLECVAAVHDHDIVHSDLKPANFLLVQGRLKLIDFGIANAIDVDNTCNVHRESHVGTPNYMSPESITDTSAPVPGSTNGRDVDGRPLKKDMRIGKASDVWSLGCILYQMTYGRPPFAHIPNQISRIMAITNPKVSIEYPERGVGGVVVPASLKGVLRKCLQRDAEARPTVQQLLAESDAFLHPEGSGAVMMSEDLLRQIIEKVVDRCRDPKKGVPTPEEVRTYPGSFMVKIREMVEKG